MGDSEESVMRSDLTRRGLLKLGMGAAGIALLQACSSAVSPTSTATSAPKATTAAATSAPKAATPAAVATQAPAAATKATEPKKGGTFTLARGAGIDEFDPLWGKAAHFPFVRAMWNTLIHYDSQLVPQPELAEKWSFSGDGKTMTLSLRQGVKYHSGREFTSDDVKQSVQFATTDTNNNMRVLHANIKQVETPDKYTAVLKFDGVFPGIYDALDVLYMIDKESIADRAKTAVGTGPFKFDKYLPNDRLEMVAFKDYWEKGKPYLDRYIVRQIPDVAAMSINLESGAVDCIWEPSPRDLTRLANSGGKYVTDQGAPGASMFNVAINVKAPPFTDKRVRQAVAWSIDRARFARTTLQGLVQPTNLMWPTHSWAYFKDLEGKISYDLEKAKALLKDAGVSGFETEILTSGKTVSGYSDLAQMLQADLTKVGINAKISDLEPTMYSARINKGDMQVLTHAYGRANRDPGSLLSGAKAWYNEKEGGWTHIDSVQYDELRKSVNAVMDREQRQALCRKIQEMVLDECFIIPVAPNQKAWAYASYVKGFSYNMDDAPYAANVWLDK